ncbi:MAG TPA: S16 family serine protease [Thermoanaerobaculia bacterium]|nr:S16 family serine protease [Thermoanaerobaculia bacterium]
MNESPGLANLLVEIGELDDAENEATRLLQQRQDDSETLSLLAKIKHIRGELSEAFALWAQERAVNPEGGAQMRLESLLQLVKDPERGTGEFLAVGQFHLWRKPAELLKLEEVFRLFVARRPGEARDACDALAEKYRGKDADLFKLALLAKAWIAELSGDLAGACAVLEQLGRERGFEGDVDRALALARVYEQLGGREHLEKAVNVCEFLARTLEPWESVTTLGRLAVLHRALERGEEAAIYEQRFLEAFQHRMHRLTLAQATSLAASRYVPLDRLAAVRFASTEPPVEAPPRQRALAMALLGDRTGAAGLLRGEGDLLDRKYLADLALLAGNREAAIRLYLAALAEDPGDRWVIRRLLGEADLAGAAPVVAAFQRPETGELAQEILESSLREAPLRSEYWRELAALHEIRGQLAEARRCGERARILAAAAERQANAVGRSLSAAVYHFAGRAKGLVHEVWAQRRPAAPGRGGYLEEILGGVTPDLERSVRNIFLSVREYAQAKLPHQTAGLLDFNYSYKITKEDEPSHGASAGLPSALAFLSVFLDRPLPQDLASSGELVADAHDVLVVRPVGEADFKLHGAYNRNLRALILPEGNRTTLAASFRIPRAVREEMVRYVPDLDAAVSLVFGSDIWLR